MAVTDQEANDLFDRANKLDEQNRIYRDRMWAAERELGELRACLGYIIAFAQPPDDG